MTRNPIVLAWVALIVIPSAVGGITLGAAIESRQWSMLIATALLWSIAGISLHEARWDD